jgi:hypothetical protein
MFKQDYPNGLQQIETLLAKSAIEASLFLPFMIFRLRPYAVDRCVTLTVLLFDTGNETPQTHELQLTWHSASDTLLVPPVQTHILTEWAACGIALALVPLYIPYRVLEVAQSGARFDYWLGETVREVGLEVSGTIYGDLVARTQIKQQQLKRNPYKSAGYVCVVGFEKQQVRLSFYQKVG